MSVIKKIKQGASDAARKAQQTLEVTKMKARVSSKEKEIEKTIKHICSAVYEAWSEGQWKQAAEQEINMYCLQVKQLHQDIRDIEQRINLVRNEKVCTCGKIVSIETRYCPDCGAAVLP
jgi:hypothetical protein